MANSKDPDEMPHDAAFHKGLNYLLRSEPFPNSVRQRYAKLSSCKETNTVKKFLWVID